MCNPYAKPLNPLPQSLQDLMGQIWKTPEFEDFPKIRGGG